MAFAHPYFVATAYVLGHIALRKLIHRSIPASDALDSFTPAAEVPPNAPATVSYEVPDACDNCALANTVDSIDRHVYICNPYDWPAKIEADESGFAGIFARRVKQLRKSLPESSFSLRITVCSRPSPSGYVDMIIYPENKMIQAPEDLSTSDMDSLITELLSPVMPFACYAAQPLPFKQAFFVCHHAARDKRCGRAGPIVIDELKSLLASRNISSEDISVFGTSHIGGHKYAGTLIVYPQAQWYGYITKKVAAELVDAVIEGRILNKCFRGMSNLQW